MTMQQAMRGNLRSAVQPYVKSKGGILAPAHAVGRWTLKAYSPEGDLLAHDEWENLVTTQGGNDALTKYLKNGTTSAAWYLFLISATPTAAAGDTFASHSGWTEVTAYSESVRQTWTGGSASAKSIDNSGAVATFTINADGTAIGGAGLGNVSTKGSSSGTDIMYAVGAFSGGNVTLSNGSTLQLTATFSL